MKKNLLSFLIIISIGKIAYAEGLKPDQRYKVIKPVYIMGVFDSLNDRTLSKSTARAYIHTQELAKKANVAFQSEVPAGTTMTIIGPAPKPWYLFFQGDLYFIRLDPDLSQGLDVTIQLDRGIEGSLDGLSSELFSRM